MDAILSHGGDHDGSCDPNCDYIRYRDPNHSGSTYCNGSTAGLLCMGNGGKQSTVKYCFWHYVLFFLKMK